MSENPESNTPLPDLSTLGMDLEKSFAPSWVKEASMPPSAREFSKWEGAEDEPASGYRERGEGRERGRQGAGKHPGRGGHHGENRGRHAQADRREPGGQTKHRPHGKEQRSSKRRAEKAASLRKPAPAPDALNGWQIRIFPVLSGVDGLAKQIRSTARAFSLFDLARLILDAPERYYFQLAKNGGRPLYQCLADNTLWLSATAAAARAFQNHRDQFYRAETEEVEVPKGNFPVIARCGVSGEWLGPPNHHSYQSRLRQVHGERAPGMPFAVYLSRVVMVRDEAMIEQWRAEQGKREFWTPLDSEGNPSGEPIRDTAALKVHFREHYQDRAVCEVEGALTLQAPSAADSEAPIAAHLRHELEKMRRFPLPLANFLAREFSTRGLQIFKSGDGLMHVGIARPRHLDRASEPVSPWLAAILDRLLASKNEPRSAQWASLLELIAGDAGERSAAEAALLKDLLWLLREGYVVDYHGKNLQVTMRPEKKQAAASNPQAAPESDASLAPEF